MSARNASFGPFHTVAQRGFGAGATGDRATFWGSDWAPSLTFLGGGIQDHRIPYNYYAGQNAATAIGVLGFYGDEPIAVSQVPAAITVGGICAAANVVALTPMTLAGASTGITVLSAATLLVPSMKTISAGLVLDGLVALIRFGRKGFTAFYDRTTMLSRCVSITGSASATGGAFLVSGYDVYGYPQTCLITATAGATTTVGLKAFKIVTSVVPQFTDAHNYSCQTTDVYGLPMLVKKYEDTYTIWNNTAVGTSANLVFADTTSPATSTTGDPRGTFNAGAISASDGTKRFSVQLTPSLPDILLNPTTGLFGQTPA